MKKLLVSILLVVTQIAQAEVLPTGKPLEDLKSSFGLFFKGSYKQFTQKNNLYYLGAAIPTTWYSFEHDDRLVANAQTKDVPKHIEIAGDMGVIFSFPIAPLGFYFFGRANENSHMMQFSMEYISAMYLALAESGLISYIQIHERPNQENLSKWETEFRGKSSWPSGHIIPFSTLFFKTLQFYGPYWAIPPAILTVITSMQRVREGRHYVSDVVGAFWLSAFASEGVRAAAKYKKNHPFYKWVFEHDARLGIIRHKDTIGPRLVWNF